MSGLPRARLTPLASWLGKYTVTFHQLVVQVCELHFEHSVTEELRDNQLFKPIFFGSRIIETVLNRRFADLGASKLF
jgi:hypothetical protein